MIIWWIWMRVSLAASRSKWQTKKNWISSDLSQFLDMFDRWSGQPTQELAWKIHTFLYPRFFFIPDYQHPLGRGLAFPVSCITACRAFFAWWWDSSRQGAAFLRRDIQRINAFWTSWNIQKCITHSFGSWFSKKVISYNPQPWHSTRVGGKLNPHQAGEFTKYAFILHIHVIAENWSPLPESWPKIMKIPSFLDRYFHSLNWPCIKWKRQSAWFHAVWIVLESFPAETHD